MIYRLDLKKYYTGVFHVHSRYSHDGRDSLGEMSAGLKKDGIDFCVITDHFEDFNAARFESYLAEAEAVNRSQETLLIPAVEAEFKGVHIIFFPVLSFTVVRSIMNMNTLPDGGLFTILAHPAKYPLTDTAGFLRTNKVDGLEIWNQLADGNYLPPAAYFTDLMSLLPGDIPAVFFGTDIHNIKHRINNLLLIPREETLTARFVVDKLRKKAFMNYNRLSARTLPGSCCLKAINDWLNEVEHGQDLKISSLLQIRKFLKFHYHLLPRSTRRMLNDIKNAVKNRL